MLCIGILRNEEENMQDKAVRYWHVFTCFHATPSVKIAYSFVNNSLKKKFIYLKYFLFQLFYIFFLLAFSYMLMFHMKPSERTIHWTTVYIIVTVCAMVIESIRTVS